MQLVDVRVDRFGGEGEVSARIGDMSLWYRVPAEYTEAPVADAFLVAALMPAMARGEHLDVSPGLSVSPRLLQAIGTIEDILHAWIPELKKVNVRAESAGPPAARSASACFFSGGVDSTYTCLKHRQETSHLILLHGLDIAPDDGAAFSSALQRGKEMADRLGKTLVPVQTNAREFCNAGGLTMMLFHGALLASVALLLGFSRNYIAASHTYDDLEPWGSHAMLDPLWSTERTEIVYDGAESGRLEKVRAISGDPELLSSLRVCANGERGRNCGKCEKCVRTMTELRLVGVSSPAFPALSPGQLRSVKITFDNLVYYVEACRVAQQIGDKEIAAALRGALRRFEVRQLAKQADAVLLGGVVRRLLDAVRPAQKSPALLRPKNAGHAAKLREAVRITAATADSRKRA
jgi:hypothetical protein